MIQQLKQRKSVRVFEDRALDPRIKDEIINSAFEAPTAGNMMLYSIIDVTDEELKCKLSVTCDNQPFIAKAPLVLVFLADYQRWYDAFEFSDCSPRTPGEGDILLACADAIIAAQNTVIASESLGIGSCYIGDILENCEEVRALLDLPDFVIPAAMLVYGYPTQHQKDRKKPVRFDKDYVVSENKYRRFTKEEHNMMQEKHMKKNVMDKDIIEWINAICKRKYMSKFSLEMNRSASEYLNKFRGKE